MLYVVAIKLRSYLRIVWCRIYYLFTKVRQPTDDAKSFRLLVHNISFYPRAIFKRLMTSWLSTFSAEGMCALMGDAGIEELVHDTILCFFSWISGVESGGFCCPLYSGTTNFDLVLWIFFVRSLIVSRTSVVMWAGVHERFGVSACRISKALMVWVLPPLRPQSSSR